jgi:hypothetical protein
MTISRYQRSPLGAFYRTPLGAFGPAGEAAPVELSGFVTVQGQITNTWMFRTANCLQAIVVLNPAVPTITRFTITIDTGDFTGLTEAQFRALPFRGLTSDYTYVPQSEAPDYICNTWTQEPGARHKLGDGIEGDPSGFPNYFYYPLVEETQRAVPGATIRTYYTAGGHGFINGESITTVPA